MPKLLQPGSWTLLAGPPKVGKSAIAADAAWCVAANVGAWLGSGIPAGRVVYLSSHGLNLQHARFQAIAMREAITGEKPLANHPIMVLPRPDEPPADTVRKIDDGGAPLALIVIDNVDDWIAVRGQLVGAALAELTPLCPVLAVMTHAWRAVPRNTPLMFDAADAVIAVEDAGALRIAKAKDHHAGSRVAFRLAPFEVEPGRQSVAVLYD